MKKTCKKRMIPITVLLLLVFFFTGCEKEFLKNEFEKYRNHSPFAVVKDIDGNTYKTVKIGEQIWMTENLKVTKYRNGEQILFAKNLELFHTYGFVNGEGAYCNYNNDENLSKTYGRLYNLYAAFDNRKIAPKGWHVPSMAEWEQLKEYLGGVELAGGKLKETGTKHWMSPNVGATNETDFTALPSGSVEGILTGGLSYLGLHQSCALLGWSMNPPGSGLPFVYKYSLSFNNSQLIRSVYNYPPFGIAIRCIKNVEPTVTTLAVNNIYSTSARSGGNVTFDGGDDVTSRGVCWSTTAYPTINNYKTSDGSGLGSFTSKLTGLKQLTTYYLRAYAINSEGISYGEQMVFTTTDQPEPLQTVTDIDGNVYKEITIGTQTWMAENLKTTHYNDGTAINEAWTTEGPAYTWYNKDVANKNVYGGLYNWGAVATNKLAPAGWHVPNLQEMETLINFLGGPTVAGGKLKETGISHWKTPNTGATDQYSFTALPGGQAYAIAFYYLSEEGNWWTSTLNANGNGHYLRLSYQNSDAILSYTDKPRLLSVRCIKDTQ